MRVISQRSFGGPDVLEVIEVDRPEPGPGEALVRVEAAGVNPGEGKIRAGRVRVLGNPPFTLGSDVSGVVEQIAPDVTRFQPGDEVYGMLPLLGGYADYVTIPAHDLAAKPPTLDHVHAAALPLAALTAWQVVVQLADVREGQRVLIHAAAGGVGHLAIQLAKGRGAHVSGTARAARHDFLRELGADELIDYMTVDFTTAARDMDVVVDLVGSEYARRSLDSLKPGGILVGAALDLGITPEEVEARGLRFASVMAEPSGEILERIAELVRTGKLRVTVRRTFRLTEAVRAHELIDTGHVSGKLVLVP
jgi:NADPH:quinone reductase-like Zn-dependent oxidoreductase